MAHTRGRWGEWHVPWRHGDLAPWLVDRCRGYSSIGRELWSRHGHSLDRGLGELVRQWWHRNRAEARGEL